MTYLLDTDIIIDHLLDEGGVRFLLQAMAEHTLAMSMITYMEAYEGVYTGQNSRRLGARFEALAKDVAVVPFGRPAARRCARLRAVLRKRESRVRGRALDLMNAAIAIEGDYTLVTRNIGDYEDIPGLKIYRAGQNAGAR